MAGIALMKGLPMNYNHNRDMQDLTPHLWRSIDTEEATLPILAEMIRTASFNTERMKEESDRGNSTTTELADLMVRAFGMPFCTAHNIVGRAVEFGDLSLETIEEAGNEMYDRSLKQIGFTGQHIDRALSSFEMVATKRSEGVPNPVMMTTTAETAGTLLACDKKRVKTLHSALSHADDIIKTDYMRLVT
jgi:argininosuccinate lyase